MRLTDIVFPFTVDIGIDNTIAYFGLYIAGEFKTISKVTDTINRLSKYNISVELNYDNYESDTTYKLQITNNSGKEISICVKYNVFVMLQI